MANEEPIVLAHVVWMDRYDGDTHTIWRAAWDWESAGHQPAQSGEQHLFRNSAGECFGCVPRFFKRDGESIFKRLDLSNLGAPGKQQFSPVTVVWTATPPFGSDRVIVGWYRNATAFEHPIEGNDNSLRARYYFRGPHKNATLLPATRRKFAIPLSRKSGVGGPGHDSIYYASRKAPKLARRIKEYIEQWDARGREAPVKQQGVPKRTARQPDVPKRLQVEFEGMAAVDVALTAADWQTEFVHLERCGWDLTARRGKSIWLVEIKGLSSSTISIELTSNEYSCSKHRSRTDGAEYIIAVVTDSLDIGARRVHFFRRFGAEWLQTDPTNMKKAIGGSRLRLDRELVAARFFVAD